MLNYYDGTVFNLNTQAIVNAVNCVGVMGAGIALEFKLRYPQMYEDYELKCKEKKLVTGVVDYYLNDDGKIIVSFPTKWHFKYPSKLSWIEQGLQNFKKTYKQHNITSIAFPKLGASNGGLRWEDVKVVMERYLSDLDIDVYICLDLKREAEGVEKIMLDRFNTSDTNRLSMITKLNTSQKEKIEKMKPYNRFWMIGQTESIGIKTYSSIFNYFYREASKRNVEPEQISLFE